MLHPRRSIWWLIAGVTTISSLAWFANTYTPDSWQMIAIFLALITIIATSFLLYFLNNVRHIFLIIGGFLILLILRLLGLREIIYPLLLLASLVSIELMLKKR